jgi:glycogen operon protein
VDWQLADTNADLLRFFRLMVGFRKRSPLLRRSTYELHGENGFHINWHGVKRIQPDWSHESRTLGMQLTQLHDDGSREDFHLIANAFTDDLDFELPQIGEREWFRLADTAEASPLDIVEEGQESPLFSQESYRVQARSVALFVAK